jgi:serine/threonine protein kinase
LPNVTTSEAARCPRCGAPRAGRELPLDLCPACLLAGALSADDEPCPYQVMTPIDDDSNGVTYLAQALTGARTLVALKICHPREDAETVLSRYGRWQPALAEMQHPSAGKLLDVGLTAEGRLYVATAYVPGRPLTALASRVLSMSDRLELAHQITGAVAAAHAAGVVHLKLSSSKVKISTANGARATVLGFGAALVVDGMDGPPDLDRRALARIIQELGIER